MSLTNHKVDIPEGKSGPWEVKKFVVTQADADFSALRSMFSFGSRGRSVPAGTYTGIYRNGTVIMSDTPDEIRDHIIAIHQARGRCLITGLGLGMVAEAMLRKPEVEHVTVIDLSPDVIKLVGPTLLERYGDRLDIIQADAMEWKPPKGAVYHTVWHDIWDDICVDNLKEMGTLHRRYGRKCAWQGSWGKELLIAMRRRGY